MNILSDSDPFLCIQDNSSSPLSLPLKKSSVPVISVLTEESFDLSSKKIEQIGNVAKDLNVTSQQLDLSNIVRWTGMVGKKLIVEPIKEATEEEVKQALSENKLGRMEKTENNTPVFKFPKQQAKILESLGITTVEVRGGSSRVQTFTSFNFQELSDQELNLLITHAKAYIVFLKTKGNSNDPKVERAIVHLELKLQYLEIEKAIRTKDPRLKELLEELVKTNPYKVSWKILELLAQKKLARKKREKKDDQKFMEIKYLTLSKEIINVLVNNNITEKEVVENNRNLHDVMDMSGAKNINNVGRYINKLKEFYDV